MAQHPLENPRLECYEVPFAKDRSLGTNRPTEYGQSFVSLPQHSTLVATHANSNRHVGTP